MRYMLIVKANGFSETGVNHGQEHVDTMMNYKKSLAIVGALLAAEELQPSASGIRVCYPPGGGEPEIQVGPFSADQELVAEYVLIDVRTEKEALEWALRIPIRLGVKSTIEIRRLEEKTECLLDAGTKVMEANLKDHLHMLRKF